jgi:hypothetical protein
MSIKLISCEHQEYQVSPQIIKLSKLLDTMADCEDSDSDPNSDIVLNIDIKSCYLDKIIEFSEQFIKNPFKEFDAPLHNNNLTDHGVPEWADKFIIRLELQELHQLMMCANYLDMQSLLQLACIRIACMIRSKTPEEISDMWKDVDVTALRIGSDPV